jgi:hypothetical protein
MDRLHGDERYSYRGWHSGNQIRTTFYNDGMVGHRRNINPDDIYGEWPINSGHLYLPEIALLVESEVEDENGDLKHIVSESHGTNVGIRGDHATGDLGPAGEWWTFCPLPGFADDTAKEIAMSHRPQSWPAFWPDKTDDSADPGWPGAWNGYFGKNELNADQESYYVIDDYNNREFSFLPDSSTADRRGLGMRVTLRGFQWSHVLVEDVLFLLYDIKNIGTTDHPKMNFGSLVGVSMGRGMTGFGDAEDDCGAYSLEEEMSYSFDNDDVGDGGWTPVGTMGCAFFESPGNPFDGIDNDGDGGAGSGSVVTEAMFEPRTVSVGDPIVRIDYTTYERTADVMPDGPVIVSYRGRTLEIRPGDTLAEVENDLIDNNLNGLIDENNGSTFGTPPASVTKYLYLGLKVRDFSSGNAPENPLIDERRDDGKDNNGDWNPMADDLGLDGIRGGNTTGENDGRPTSGWQAPGAVPGVGGTPNPFGLLDTGLPGEPRIDKTDINESDMIGLTAFNLYAPYNLYPLWDDEKLWEGLKPGLLDDILNNANVDLMFGSGYFPMKPGQIERFSLGSVLGLDRDELFRNKKYAEKTYLENYNFAKAPILPTLTAVAGDRRVTLTWDDAAERSVDPITGDDFEGYRIYRSTDKTWGDMKPVTDGYGSVKYLEPMAQFDLRDGIRGFSEIAVSGVQFWLGDDTGLSHSFVDTTAVNGFMYYYAVTAYDRGDPSKGIAPAECSKYISVTASGEVNLGRNVAMARPEAPSAGYVSSSLDSVRLLPPGTATGAVGYHIVNTQAVPDVHSFRITFEDTLLVNRSTYSPFTSRFSLVDVTDPEHPDTLIARDRGVVSGRELPVTHGFRLSFANAPALAFDSIRSEWNRQGLHPFEFKAFSVANQKAVLHAAEYRIEFGETGMDTSSSFSRGTRSLPALPVNFRVVDVSRNRSVRFALYERDAVKGQEGQFTAFTAGGKNATDEIIFLDDSLVAGWQFSLVKSADTSAVSPRAGDAARIRLLAPFLSHDVYEFITRGETIDAEAAKAELDRVKVVPNPYIVANDWEPQNPYASGRGPRELHFIHLPSRCTIKIFNMNGQLVDTIVHVAPAVADGTEIWDLLSKDRLSISFGVYFYHIDAGPLGQRVGKFAVIK